MGKTPMGLKKVKLNINFDVNRFKRLLLVFCMLYVQCIVLILVLTAAACGLYQSRFQAEGSIALYALAVTSVNVILIMLGTAVIGLYAALKLSRFVIACHALGLCSVIVLKMLLSILYFIAIQGAVNSNTAAMKTLFDEKKTEENIKLINEAQQELKCCGPINYRYYNNTLPSSCCPHAIFHCTETDVFIDGCLFKIGQLVRVPTIVTGVAMICMTLLELVGVAISYGLLKSIALKDGTIDFRAMFRDRIQVLNESFARPFKDDGFAKNMFVALKKRAASLDLSDGDEEEEEKEAEIEGVEVVKEKVGHAETPPPNYLENHVGSSTLTETHGVLQNDDTYISSPSLSSQT